MKWKLTEIVYLLWMVASMIAAIGFVIGRVELHVMLITIAIMMIAKNNDDLKQKG